MTGSDLAANIKRRRRALGLSYSGLALYVDGMTPSMIHRLEHGDGGNEGHAAVIRLLDVLGMELVSRPILHSASGTPHTDDDADLT